MTVSGIDRLHSQLSKLEDMFPGYLTEIVEGSIVMNPVRPFHGRTIRKVSTDLEAQLAPVWELVSDVAFPFDDANEFCPDIAVIPAEVEAENRSSYSPDLIEFVAEVVSPESIRRDYEIKPRWYASRAIANYVILDPLRGHAVTMWNPGPDGYRGRDTIPYGPDLTVDSPLGKLTIPTGRLPVDPKAPHQS
ncbi:Uma2 family endonuclease [Streptomyces sp. ISL-22]|uniref:Uma2 family endonuclease n=1 Tax=unclassified Streptomyces TaxID=2593676 RepID=UPI001BECC0B3|nr:MULTISPECIES: Uma2 family endonuclease [unclassified Streptomyces]MBT2419130.1 Uma2 family endonuclease [Streptomyces sp. ISL-24]MBT2431225.1 Uma2 family endonuclease [Streptomyces sp. ISL-22]